jgi:hypothetical protein
LQARESLLKAVLGSAVPKNIGLYWFIPAHIYNRNKITNVKYVSDKITILPIHQYWAFLQFGGTNRIHLRHVHKLFSAYFHKLFKIVDEKQFIAYIRKVWLSFIFSYRDSIFINTYYMISDLLLST